MIGASRSLSLLLALLLACSGDDGATSASTQATASTSDAASGSTDATDTDTGATDTATATAGSTGVDDGCMTHALGEWNACKNGPLTDNSKCNGEAGSPAISCLLPSSGGGNVCSVTGCASVCDCFAPPATGDAVVVCAPILADGNACILDCGGGQTCPDGMGCKSGYCYWLDG